MSTITWEPPFQALQPDDYHYVVTSDHPFESSTSSAEHGAVGEEMGVVTSDKVTGLESRATIDACENRRKLFDIQRSLCYVDFASLRTDPGE